MDAGLGVGIALHADGLARAFARAGVGLGALAAHRETAHVTNSAIALDALQTFQIHAEFADVSCGLPRKANPEQLWRPERKS